MKKSLSLILAVILVLSMFVPAVGAIQVTFTDLKPGAFYYNAVLWAVENGITSGTSPSTFSPGNNCTRDQVVTFLWRAAGKPEPTSYNHPFTDINPEAFSYKAILWAVENNITNGMTPTTFAPSNPCTRAEVVTFLYRSKGTPDTSASNPFTDVKESGFYYSAMLWAVENGITTGTSNTTFSPSSTCTRGQFVTFLYRSEGSPEVEPPYGPVGPSGRVFVYTGSGDDVITDIDLPKGEFYAEYIHRGSRNFITSFYYGSDEYDYTRISNKIGNCSGQTYLDDTRNTAYSDCYLQVQADGDWIVRIVEVFGSSTSNVAGTGDIVTGIFTAKSAQTPIRLTHSGSRNFITRIWEVGGDEYDYETITNETGNYSGTKLVTLTPGKQYFISIIADGNWTIDLGQGEPVTNYRQPTYNPTEPEDPEDPNAPEKYDFNDAKSLNSYAANCTSKCSSDVMRLINEAYSVNNLAMRKYYLTMAQSHLSIVINYLDSSLAIMEGKVDLDLTNSEFDTLEDLIRDTRANAQALVDLEITEDNVNSIIGDFQTSAMSDVYTQCLLFQKLTVELLKAFN